jgi:tetratricopeptide (TPR) repeat protein
VQILRDLDWLSAEETASRYKALAKHPQSPERDVELALMAISLGLFDDALRYAEPTVARLPGNEYAAYAYGVICVQSRQWQKALDALLTIPVDFERANEVAVLCALALLELGRLDDAERIAEAVAGSDDETRGTLAALRGRCAAAKNKPELAAQLFDEAILFAPKLDWVRKLRSALTLPMLPSDVTAVVI